MLVEVTYTDEVPEGSSRVYEVDGLEIAVFRVDDEIYAVENTCTHAGGSLGDGGFRDGIVMCPRHGAEFDVQTGEPLDTPVNPASKAVETYDVEVQDGVILIDV